ncbi:S8 family serine peptidase [Alteribacter populi]|uniref:S8 family serine peptidase n=1 Tax=Alteribacter populi TaxID=2011011 RepID=UPI000C2B8F6D|nr:S8 family serine peptidase [Alteribacter populi]
MRKAKILLSFVLVMALFVSFLPGQAIGSLLGDTTKSLKETLQEVGVETTVDPLLDEALKAAEGPVEVIVTFNSDEGPGASEIGLLEQLGIETGVALESLPIAGVLATKEQVIDLTQLDEVRSVYLNSELEYENFDSTALTGVDRMRTDNTIRTRNGGVPVSGQGVGVVVNDSGIDGTHEDHKFGNNLVQNVMAATNLNALSSLLPVSYVEDVPNTDSDSGHGTHVAGTVGGTGKKSSGKYEGVAPGANLIGYGSGAGLFILDTLGGFDYAITHQNDYNIRVITNSWGSPSDVGTDFDPDHPTNIATKEAAGRGITVIFSAGNSGPGEDTITGNFKKAPWVITVAAGDRNANLGSFSSRGLEVRGGTVDFWGEEVTWEDRPTVTAPGVNIVSTRTTDPLSVANATDDAEVIETGHLPYYTIKSGTSMAAPHVAGIVALLLEVDPSLSPIEIQEILEETATNMPGYSPSEVGAGYVNAYAAVDQAFERRDYGEVLNMNREFNSEVHVDSQTEEITIDYNPAASAEDNQYTFDVEEDLTQLAVRVDGHGFFESGNPINLVLIAPDGTEYSSGISLLFTLFTDRTVIVNSPDSGEWAVEIRGLHGDELNPIGTALPEEVEGTITTRTSDGYSGLNDIENHPEKDAIIMAVYNRLIDGNSNGEFRPDDHLTRGELAKYLTMGAGIRQYLPLDGADSFKDINKHLAPYVEATTARGSALLDRKQQHDGVILPTSDDKFSPNGSVNRAELAYSLVQSLGLQEGAKELQFEEDEKLTVYLKGESIAIEDSHLIPDELKGYVQQALNLNLMNAYFELEQGGTSIEPEFTATFEPTSDVTRAEYAAYINRHYSHYSSLRVR